MRKRNWILPVLLLLIAACTPLAPTISPEDITPTATLPNPQVHITPAPDIDSVVSGFMEAWEDENYTAMYGLLTAEIQAAISEAVLSEIIR